MNYELRVNQGYTFVELLVVTSVFLVIMGTVGGLFFSSLRGTTKVTLTNEAKQNGDFAINILERNVKDARSIVNAETVCDNSNTKVATMDVIASDGSAASLNCPALGTNGSISLNSEVLTSTKVSVSDCYFICSRATPNSPPLVKIHFTIGQALSNPSVTLRPDQKVSIDYETSVQIRNVGF